MYRKGKTRARMRYASGEFHDSDSVHAERGQSREFTPAASYSRPFVKVNGHSDAYMSFLRKYEDLEQYVDSFTTLDLVFYFREVAQANGYKYVIANVQKDMAIMKRLKESYSVPEILGMIDFLYESEQDYLRKDTLSPNVLASNWCNTIYADTMLWVDDKYVPASKRGQAPKPEQSAREWKRSSDSRVKIGGKLS